MQTFALTYLQQTNNEILASTNPLKYVILYFQKSAVSLQSQNFIPTTTD